MDENIKLSCGMATTHFRGRATCAATPPHRYFSLLDHVELDLVAQTCSSTAQEAEVRGLLRVWAHPGEYNEFQKENFRKCSGSGWIYRNMNFSTVRSQGERKAGTQQISSFYPAPRVGPHTFADDAQMQGGFSPFHKLLCEHPWRHSDKEEQSHMLGDIAIISFLFSWS